MNKLLKRQIKKALGNREPSEEYKYLLELINETYNHNDEDRRLMDRMMEITSDEMIKLHEKTKLDAIEALQLANSRLHLATKGSDVGIWENDLIAKKIVWDETTFKLHGTNSNETNETDTWEQCVNGEERVYTAKQLTDAIIGRKDFDFEYKVTWPNSSIHYIRTKGTIQRNEKGRPLRIIGTKWDVTDRREAQSNMQNEKELADSVINSLPVIFFLFNKEGKFLRWNTNLLDVTGYTEEDMSTITPLDFFDVDEKEKMQNEIMLVLTNGHSDSEANLFTKSKKKIPYYFNSITINYKGEECVIGTGTNITARMKMEENLRAKNKDLEEFAHIVSHNLRAPVAKIQGLTALLNTEAPEGKDNLSLMNYTKDEVENLDRIIREMNDIISEKDYVSLKRIEPNENETPVKINNIYLIDDDSIVNMVSKRTIEKNGFAEKIHVHQNAVNALEKLRDLKEENPEEIPQIIFLDINMPEMNGWEFLDEFEKFEKSVKEKCSIYMLTSSIDTADIKRSQTYSCVKDFVTKPLTKDKLSMLNI